MNPHRDSMVTGNDLPNAHRIVTCPDAEECRRSWLYDPDDYRVWCGFCGQLLGRTVLGNILAGRS